MDMVGLGAGEAAALEIIRLPVERGDRDLGDHRAGPRKPAQRCLEGLLDFGIEILERRAAWQEKAKALRRNFGERGRRLPGEDGIVGRAAGDRVGERADRVERGREREGALARDAARGRLEARDAAKGRRLAYRAARIGAERHRAHPVGLGDRAPRGRASGHAPGLAVPGIARGAVVRVEADAAEGELHHIGTTDEHRARGAQARDGGTIRRLGRRACEDARSGAGHLARHVEQILQGHRQAVDRGAAHAAPAQGVGVLGVRARAFRVHLQEGARAFPGLLGDPRERLLDQIAA